MNTNSTTWVRDGAGLTLREWRSVAIQQMEAWAKALAAVDARITESHGLSDRRTNLELSGGPDYLIAYDAERLRQVKSSAVRG
jgi:hypothetical protein